MSATDPKSLLSGIAPPGVGGDERLELLLQRINTMAKNQQSGTDSETSTEAPPADGGPENGSLMNFLESAKPTSEESSEEPFVPLTPTSFVKAGLTETMVEALVVKCLLARGDASGHTIAEQLNLPFGLIHDFMLALKNSQLVVMKSAAPMNDYVYQLTDLGTERARRYSQISTYFGSAPVTIKDYVESIQRQSLDRQHPTREHLEAAFDDLLITQEMFERLGPAINSGRGLFLFGAPGNGKTSIAERITRCFGETIWIPRALNVEGEIMRLYDPTQHIEMPLPQVSGIIDKYRYDRRWVRIRRPTIVVGGELTLDRLEVTVNTTTGINEAPLQMKSNCGTLVIDDFGRQRCQTADLLNRWIVPLEKRYDFLNLASGKKIEIPFDQLIVFSTNLEPRDLVDEAFLRRIPYKIEVIDPTEKEFRDLFRMMCPIMEIEYDDTMIDYLIEKHYRSVSRQFRCCQPRDLLLQIRNYCLYCRKPLELTERHIDLAVKNYFAVM